MVAYESIICDITKLLQTKLAESLGWMNVEEGEAGSVEILVMF